MLEYYVSFFLLSHLVILMLPVLLYLVISGKFFMVFLFFTFCCTVWHVGSLFPHQGLNRSSPAQLPPTPPPPQRKQSLNHWTNREVPVKFFVVIHLGLKWSHLLQRDLRSLPARLLGSLRVRYHRRSSSVLKVPLLTHAVRTWPVFTCLFLVETSTTSSMGYFRTFGGRCTGVSIAGHGLYVCGARGLSCSVACGTFIPWPVIQTSPSAVRARVGSAALWLVGSSSLDQWSKPHLRQ